MRDFGNVNSERNPISFSANKQARGIITLYEIMSGLMHRDAKRQLDSFTDLAKASNVLPLTDWSVRNNSNSIRVPDFTAGAWKTNKRNMDINLMRGATTRILS